jgi:hypothetical protein
MDRGGKAVSVALKQDLINTLRENMGKFILGLPFLSVSRCYQSWGGASQNYRLAFEILHGSRVGESTCFS